MKKVSHTTDECGDNALTVISLTDIPFPCKNNRVWISKQFGKYRAGYTDLETNVGMLYSPEISKFIYSVWEDRLVGQTYYAILQPARSL